MSNWPLCNICNLPLHIFLPMSYCNLSCATYIFMYEVYYVCHIIFYYCNIVWIVISLCLCETVSFNHVLSVTTHLIITMTYCFHHNIVSIVPYYVCPFLRSLTYWLMFHMSIQKNWNRTKLWKWNQIINEIPPSIIFRMTNWLKLMKHTMWCVFAAISPWFHIAYRLTHWMQICSKNHKWRVFQYHL